jgi:3-dehydroquinate synthase
MSDQHKVTVELGTRAYEIHIGSGVLARAADYIAPVLSRPKLAIIADANLAENHLPMLQATLDSAGIAHDSYLVPERRSQQEF